MKERYLDYNKSPYFARVIFPDEETKKHISNELERTLKRHIEIKGIIVSNIPDYGATPSTVGPLWNFMCNLKLKHFGKEAYNTGAYRSFEYMKSALTPARTQYKKGAGSARFDMIIYERV